MEIFFMTKIKSKAPSTLSWGFQKYIIFSFYSINALPLHCQCLAFLFAKNKELKRLQLVLPEK
jgi:hypothetical protein